MLTRGLVTRFKVAVPVPVKASIRRSVGRLTGILRKNSFECPICKSRVAAFVPLSTALPTLQRDLLAAGHDLEAAETLNKDAYLCPVCESSDRDRLYALWISHWLQRASRQTRPKLVDFAPSASLASFLRKRFDYRSADLFSPSADDRVDLQNMSVYADARFDAFLCSHVLEHVPDDQKAMAELFRILAPGGWGIAMVPINSHSSETDEEIGPLSDRERLRRFGQADHLRFYAAEDFKQRLTRAGFEVECVASAAITGAGGERFGIHARSVLYVVHKAM